MLKKSTNYINLISIAILIYIAFIPLKPQNTSSTQILDGGFFMENAVEHIETITKIPHYVGSQNHSKVQRYIVKQLQKLNLDVKIQKTNATRENKFSPVENIIAKIQGTNKDGKSLVVMSHYDSVPFASFGAGDNASGIAVVLEGIRAFITKKIAPKNDIIILFTDAEEIGLLGAKAFVNKHRWGENIGAILNFEARGTAGSSYMLMETNHGNHNLLEHYKNANIKFPNSNSLAYSIYKALPNDTDLTVFRKDKDYVGYNFAFIDDVFNYHTALDNSKNLSLDSVAHQAYYLMAMLQHLSQIDLSSLQSDQDDVYLKIPFWKTINYPFSWAVGLSFLNLIIFILVLFTGIKNNTIRVKSILPASYPLFKSLIVSALLSFIVLKFLYWVHPHYDEILQGFTYNGYRYIALFCLLTFSITYFFYNRNSKNVNTTETMVIPLFIWIITTLIIAKTLIGAHFFIIVSAFSTFAFMANVLRKKSLPNLTLMLFAPVVILFSPLLVQLPVALGLVLLPFSNLLLVLLLAPFISSIHVPKNYPINRWLFIIAIISVYIYAETNASFNSKRPLPNSLFYFQDQPSNEAYMLSYDYKLDDWTKPFFENNKLNDDELQKFKNTFWRRTKIAAKIENKNLEASEIIVKENRIYSDKRIIKLIITNQRRVNKIFINTKADLHIFNLSVNKEPVHSFDKAKLFKENKSIVSINTANDYMFTLDIEIKSGEDFDISIIEMSHDLLTSPEFKINKRTVENIAKPYIYSDSIIVKQNLKL